MTSGQIATIPKLGGDTWNERHYTILELSKIWNLAPSTLREWFTDEPGVLKQGHSGIRSNKRPYMTLRIPESVARRVHAERSRGWAEGETEKKRAARSRTAQGNE